MGQTARAAVLVKPKTLEIREFPLPAIGPGDALLRIEACGICGTDYEQYEGGVPPHDYYTPFPVIPGHEPLGLIAAIGERARERWGVDVGDRVAVRSGYGCGTCEACRRGEPRHCRVRGGTYGFTDVRKPPALWGGYADYLYLSPLSAVRKMDRSLPAGVAVLFNPLAAGLSWAGTVPKTGPGDRIVILGPGQRGLCCVVAAREASATRHTWAGGDRRGVVRWVNGWGSSGWAGWGRRWCGDSWPRGTNSASTTWRRPSWRRSGSTRALRSAPRPARWPAGCPWCS